MTSRTKYIILYVVGLVVCIAPPVVAVLLNFPVWVQKSSAATLSGVSLVLLVLCCIPFYKAILSYIKSASSPVMWLLLFVFCFHFGAIVDEMTVISFVGVISNTVGAVIFKIAKKYKRE